MNLNSISQPASAEISFDALTARTYLTSALSQYLGVYGTSIPIDILKIGSSLTGVKKENRRFELWMRVPNDDIPAVAGAVSSWVGDVAGEANVAFRTRLTGAFLGPLVNGTSEELFAP